MRYSDVDIEGLLGVDPNNSAWRSYEFYESHLGDDFKDLMRDVVPLARDLRNDNRDQISSQLVNN